jgi:hypothetical protein
MKASSLLFAAVLPDRTVLPCAECPKCGAPAVSVTMYEWCDGMRHTIYRHSPGELDSHKPGRRPVGRACVVEW